MTISVIHVVKLGGSLLDLPDLVWRLERVRRRWCDDRLAIVVGGGRATDLVRQWDATFHLGDGPSHWLAIHAMQMNSDLLLRLMDRVSPAADRQACDRAWRTGEAAVIDPLAWLDREQRYDGVAVPHEWAFTSDSIAAHLAVRLAASRLTLLKSVDPVATDLNALAALGKVDAPFARTSANVPRIDWINLRNDELLRHTLKPAVP